MHNNQEKMHYHLSLLFLNIHSGQIIIYFLASMNTFARNNMSIFFNMLHTLIFNYILAEYFFQQKED